MRFYKNQHQFYIGIDLHARTMYICVINNIGETVAVTGMVESIKESSSGSSCFIELNDGTGKINLIIFESTLVELQDAGNDLESFENQKVKVIGSITEYKSSMELILSNSNSIKLVS